MTDLSALYQAVVLDHNRAPRNCRAVEPHDAAADGNNPLCGDWVRVELRFDAAGRIETVGFTGEGCAISRASASIMTEVVTGRTPESVRRLSDRFEQLVTDREAALPESEDPELEQLLVLAGVRDYPMRVRCATLAWHTLRAAIESSAPADSE